MPDKNISELLNIVRAGAGVTLNTVDLTVDDVLPVVRAAGESQVPVRLVGALQWRTHDLVQLAKAGKGRLILE